MCEQRAVPCSIWRGGTSRALFFQEAHLPAPGEERERCLLMALGVHDPYRVDGLGGMKVTTTKVAIISPPSHPLADVDYLAGVAAPGQERIHWDNNCGNILSAVGPYALDQSLVQASADPQRVRIFNRNEKALIDAYIPVTAEGKARLHGDFVMAGVPGSGAPIFLDFCQSLKAGELLPTGLAQQEVDGIPITLCRGASFCLLVWAQSLGIRGDESPTVLNLNEDFLQRATRLHQKGGELLGLVAPGEINQSAAPFLICMSGSPPDLHVIVVGLGHCHPAVPGTAALTLGVACQMAGTILPETELDCLRLHHPTGIMEVFTRVRCRQPLEFERLGYQRTARKLMQGEIYIPQGS